MIVLGNQMSELFPAKKLSASVVNWGMTKRQTIMHSIVERREEIPWLRYINKHFVWVQWDENSGCWSTSNAGCKAMNVNISQFAIAHLWLQSRVNPFSSRKLNNFTSEIRGLDPTSVHSLLRLPKACWWDLNDGRNSCPGQGCSRGKFSHTVEYNQSEQWRLIPGNTRPVVSRCFILTFIVR